MQTRYKSVPEIAKAGPKTSFLSNALSLHLTHYLLIILLLVESCASLSILQICGKLFLLAGLLTGQVPDNGDGLSNQRGEAVFDIAGQLGSPSFGGKVLI